MRIVRTLIAIAAVLCVAQPTTAQTPSTPAPDTGRLHVDIERGNLNPMPIAIVDFVSSNPNAAAVGRDVAGVIRANLDRSGLFRPVEPSAFIERIQDMNVPPRFADWRVINAQALVVGQ